MTAIEYLDRPPTGWFALNVMRRNKRKWDWVALMVDVHPDDLKHCLCRTAFLYVHRKNTSPMEAALRTRFGSAYPASTGTGKRHGAPLRT
jgi:hypothetical protein